MIGSYEGLFNASQGRMAPRVVTPKAPILEPYSGGLDRAGRANDLAQAQMASGSSLLGGFDRASGGLSAKGKYSGFFSAGDQQAAIEGAARGIKGSAEIYRAKADAFMNKLNPIYGEAAKGPSRAFISQGTAQMPGVNEKNWQKVTPGGYIDKIVNPSRKYANQLNDWYSKQSAPAVKYQATADQIERTPISQFATQIATNAYGMNPDLAIGKFAGLDKTYYTEQEDIKSIRDYGMPAAEYKAQQEDLLYGTSAKKITSADEAFAATELDKVTNVGSKFLSAATGQTADQMYKVLEPEFVFTNPETKTSQAVNGAWFAQKYSTYLQDGQFDKANQFLSSVPQDRQDLKKLLQAIQSITLQKAGKAAIGTMTYESFLSSLDPNG